MLDPTGLHQLTGDRLSPVDRDRESETGSGAGAHQGVDPDDLPIGIEKGAAGISGVDGGIGLDQIQPLA